MLNYETTELGLVLTDKANNMVGLIKHTPTDTGALWVVQMKRQYHKAWWSLEAAKYHALALHLEQIELNDRNKRREARATEVNRILGRTEPVCELAHGDTQ
jgi:hypothetical protein